MVADVVVPFRGRRGLSGGKKPASRRDVVDCWRRLHDVIQEIPDEDLKQEALEFWSQKVPKILHGS